MSDYELTDEQKKAVYTKNKNIIVSAQAGAGKTDILVERIILNLRGLESKDSHDLGKDLVYTGEKTDIEDVLVVTFTNKAAQEMKDRIKKKLAIKIEEEGIADKKFLIEQLNKVNNAQISTMHSFCINTIRSYFQNLDINPQFKILNQASLKVLSWEAMDETFLTFYESENQEFFDFLFEYSGLKDDELLKIKLMGIYNFIRSQINPFDWLEKVRQGFDKSGEDLSNPQVKRDKYLEYMTYIRDYLEDEIYDLQIDIKHLEDFSLYNILPEFTRDYIEEGKMIVDKIVKYFKKQDYESLIDFLSKLKFKRMKSIPKNQVDDYSLEDFESFKKERNDFKSSIKDFLSLLDLDLEASFDIEKKQFKYISIIEKILISYHKIFSQKKKAKGGIDFSDAEHYMIDLLQDDSIAWELRDKYKYIFFDEYQDANQVQNWIVEKIKRRDNLFFVGDIKQSIYKFRLADPSIFNERYNSYRFDEAPYKQAVELSRNFRSRPEVLDFTNFIFDKLMTKRLGEVDYKDPAHRLNPGAIDRVYDDKIASLCPVEINYIIKSDLETSYAGGINQNDLVQLDKESNQPYMIAKKIRSMMDEGFKAKSFAILLRNKQMIPEICDYLEVFDIPYYTDSKDLSYTDLEVSEFINILKAIDNDKKDLILLSALLSVVGGFNESELALIRSGEGDKSFYNSFYAYEDRPDGQGDLIDKIKKYREKLEAYKNIEKTMSLYDFAWYVLIDSGFMTYLLSSFNGKQRLDNVVAFIEEIKDYQETAQPGLYNFLNHVDRLMQKSVGDLEPGAELSEEDDVVRLMTIHKSKGLQIDNVIIANTEKRFNKMDINNQFIYLNDYKMALKTYNPETDAYEGNLFFDYIAWKKELELLSEEIRLQYVALTRARHQVIIFSEVKEDFFDKLGDNYRKMKSPIEWLSSIVLQDKISEEFKNSHDIAIHTSGDRLKDSKLKIDLNLYDKAEILDEKLKFFGYIDKKDDEDKKIASKEQSIEVEGDLGDFSFLDYSYPHILKSQSPLKKTVSQLASQNDNRDMAFKNFEKIDKDPMEAVDFDKPQFLLTEEKTSAKDIGIATHYALQVLDIKEYDEDSLEEELSRLCAESKLKPEEKKLIDKQAIILFYRSFLGKRVINAKKVYREEAFTMLYEDQDDKVLVDGQIDLFFEEDDGRLVIIDFKTGQMRDDVNYVNQLKLYDEGLSKATGKEVKEKYIYWTRANKYSKVEN
ncbi:MAG: helicase-exonuclease AddAB subunit AddA [Tissierellia bacterium]|nr:helicase-exonuclease AddAB subunit AddA [Tissierellia bacterium]